MDGISFYRDLQVPFIEGKLCQVKTMSYKKHFHEEYSIGMIDRGASRMWCDGAEFTVGAGQLIGIPPELAHACNPDERSDWSYKMLFLHPQWIRQVLGGQLCWEGVSLPGMETNGEARMILDRLMLLLKHGGSPLEAETMAIRLLELTFGGGTVPASEGEADRESASLARVRDYLHGHFAQRVPLEELERVSGISRYQIIRQFKQRHSLPPHAYQNLLRVNYAKKQLHKRGKPLSETALEAGFYDQSHFTRVFKHCVGVTPQRYADRL